MKNVSLTYCLKSLLGILYKELVDANLCFVG